MSSFSPVLLYLFCINSISLNGSPDKWIIGIRQSIWELCLFVHVKQFRRVGHWKMGARARENEENKKNHFKFLCSGCEMTGGDFSNSFNLQVLNLFIYSSTPHLRFCRGSAAACCIAWCFITGTFLLHTGSKVAHENGEQRPNPKHKSGW